MNKKIFCEKASRPGSDDQRFSAGQYERMRTQLNCANCLVVWEWESECLMYVPTITKGSVSKGALIPKTVHQCASSSPNQSLAGHGRDRLSCRNVTEGTPEIVSYFDAQYFNISMLVLSPGQLLFGSLREHQADVLGTVALWPNSDIVVVQLRI